MILRGWRVALVLVLTVATLASCSSARIREPSPQPSTAQVDYQALEDAVENRITTGPVSLDNVRAVLISVNGQTAVSHYRHGFTSQDTTHVWSVTKSVLSTLVGIAIADGLLGSLDETVADLLPQHREAMSPDVAALTLRQLMTMSAGFSHDPPADPVKAIYASHGDLVDYMLREAHTAKAGDQFLYSNVSSHLVAAVLAAALDRTGGGHPRSVLDYARERLFDPLEIDTRPAFTKPVLDDTAEFTRARFAWTTDPQGISMGAFGLRLTPPDLVKLGELYLNNGTWNGRQIVPADWVSRATAPSELEPQYGLMWWLYTWNGHRVYAARGSEGHLVVVVPDQKSVIAISSTNRQEYPMDGEALFPLMLEVIIPALDAA